MKINLSVRHVRLWFVSLCCVFFSMQVHSQVTVVDSIEFDGVWRNYRLYIPAAYQPGVILPLVFNFHGYGSNALEQELYSGFDNVADTGNFFICYPNGINNAWNIAGGTPDDVGFTDSLITVLNNIYNINLNRVYSTGLSNGGFFSNLLACQLSNKIAAIAPVAGTNINAIQASCNPARRVPVLYIHGTSDPVVAYNGTPAFVSAATLLQFWAAHNGCNNNIDTVPVPNTSIADLCTADIISWHGCDSSKKVIHYRINGGGHTWPGAAIDIGITNHDFNASGVIWNFFNQYSLATGISEEEMESINVFPNPYSKQFEIELPDEKCSATIYDINGKVMKYYSSVMQNTMIDGSNLAEGVYILKIYSNHYSRTIRLVHIR